MTRVLASALTLAAFIASAGASYCGQSGVPFSLEVGADGQPILGCARPTCFGWDAEGKRSADTAQFYRIHGKADGFLRATDVKGPVVKNTTGFVPQSSVCESSYTSEKCSESTQWIGGISPVNSVVPESEFKILCCSYERIAEAAEQGIAEIHPGQAVIGGEIKGEDGRQYAFEYISNVERSFEESGSVVYSVTTKRFSCLPEPLYLEAGVESGSLEELTSKISKSTGASQLGAKTLSGAPVPGMRYKTLPTGQVVPCTAEEMAAATAPPPTMPLLPLLPGSGIANGNIIQPSMLDPLGLFQPRTLPTAGVPSQYPFGGQSLPSSPSFGYVGVPQGQQAPGSAGVGPAALAGAQQPGASFWNPLQGLYDYSRNPAAAYGAQQQPAPVPLHVPSPEDVENANRAAKSS